MSRTEITLITLVGYLLLLVGIGVWASRRTASGEDFFLGGRGLGPWVAALSYSSSAASAWTLLGLSGIAYVYGVSTLWLALGSISSMLVVWYWIAPRLLRFSQAQSSVTLTDLLLHQVDTRLRRAIALTATGIIVFSFVFYVAAQFQGAGTTFSSSFGLPMSTSILLGATVIVIYTLLGGFWAVSVTDALQGLLMALTALFLPLTAFYAVGGWSGLAAGLTASGDSTLFSLSAGNVGWVALGIVIGGLSIGFGTYGQPHLMARIMALRDERALRQARRLTVLWYLLVFLGMWFLGLVGHVLHAGLANPEAIFFVMLERLFPPLLGAIFLAAVLSAIMSTADSQLLAAATAIAHDLGLGGTEQRRLLFFSRLTVVSLAIIAGLVAIYLPDRIFSRVLFAWVALGAAFGPTLFARLAGLRVHPSGVLLSILLGFGLTVILSQTPDAPGDVVERLLPFVVAGSALLLFRQRGDANPP